MVPDQSMSFGADIGACRNVEDRGERSIAAPVTSVTIRSSLDDIDREAKRILEVEAAFAAANDATAYCLERGACARGIGDVE
jgi:isopropylmalate/homocitrate/citramalate synthase